MLSPVSCAVCARPARACPLEVWREQGIVRDARALRSDGFGALVGPPTSRVTVGRLVNLSAHARPCELI